MRLLLRNLGLLFKVVFTWTRIRITRFVNSWRRVLIWWMRVLRDRCTECGGSGVEVHVRSGKVRACGRCGGSGKFTERWL